MELITPFSTSKLDQVFSNQALANEKVRQNLLQQIIKWLDEHGLEYGIQTAYIFGSLSQPYKFHQHSDIDIAVEQINADDFCAVIGWLSEAMARDVDIIEVNKCHFGDRIKQTGIRWTATNL